MTKNIKLVAGGPLYLAVGVIILLGSIIGYVIYQTISFGSAALVVESSPEATIYINGVRRGITPAELEVREREVAVQLVVEGTALPSFNTKVKLAEGAKTIVRRRFGDSEGQSMALIIFLEKDKPRQASVSVVSVPDDAEVYVDGQKQGLTPLRLTTSPGEHLIEVLYGAYQKESFDVRAAEGYVVKVIAQLARQ